jgi:hypothetical protein
MWTLLETWADHYTAEWQAKGRYALLAVQGALMLALVALVLSLVNSWSLKRMAATPHQPVLVWDRSHVLQAGGYIYLGLQLPPPEPNP